jgi:hypothetical protein
VCLPDPQGDSSCADGGPMHHYRCILSSLPPPCTVQGLGDVTNTFCCP